MVVNIPVNFHPSGLFISTSHWNHIALWDTCPIVLCCCTLHIFTHTVELQYRKLAYCTQYISVEKYMSSIGYDIPPPVIQ